jgi:hypothetical protein
MIDILRAFFTSLCFIIAIPYAPAQDKPANWPPKNWPHDTKNCHHLLSNTYQCGWQFFEIKTPLEGTIVMYNTPTGDKDGKSSASVAIIKTPKEMIRILFAGNSMHTQGEHIKIIAAKEPDSDLLAPFDREYYISEERKGNKPGCRVNEYDPIVLKTTWGKVAN